MLLIAIQIITNPQSNPNPNSSPQPQFPLHKYQYQQQFRMKIVFLSLFTYLFICISAQDDSQPLSKQEQVARREQEIRSQNNMSYTNVRAYTFVCGRFDDFVIKPSLTFQTKIELHVYWKQDNVYVSSEYREGEEIRLIVYEDSQKVVVDRTFYTTTGLTFTGKQGSTYIVRFLAAGTIQKLVSMITSTPVQVGEQLASKVHIDSAQTKIQRMGNELKALLTISQRNFLMKEKIGEKVLSSTQLYMLYEVFQVLAIIGVAIAQVVFLTRLLKGSSIV